MLHSRTYYLTRTISKVMAERLDSYLIEGKWLEIPICGAFDVEG
jgi:limonene-1,2-epoxide hydrolase